MKRQKKGGYCIRNGDIGDRPRSASATHSSHAMSAMLFTLYSQATALIVLGPPAHHYSHYDTKRTELYEFVRQFKTRAEGEGLFAVADNRARRDLYFDYGVENLVDSILDDIWMRDLFVTQLSDTSVVRFAYSPAYLYPMEVHYIDILLVASSTRFGRMAKFSSWSSCSTEAALCGSRRLGERSSPSVSCATTQHCSSIGPLSAQMACLRGQMGGGSGMRVRRQSAMPS